MYIKNLISSIICLFLLFACGETIDSNWKDGPIKVDGKSEDWQGITLHYHEDQKVMYGIINDDSTLNIMIRFNDSRLARMFSMRGMILWLNDEDEEEKKIGFHYRDRFTRGQMNSIGDRERLNGNRDKKMQMPAPVVPPQGIFSLALNDSLSEISINNIEGLTAEAGYENGMYCYEFGIPLLSINVLPYYLNVSPKKAIKVGLEICAVSEEERDRMKEQMAKRRSGGMKGGGMRGGGMMGGGGRRGGGMRGGGGMQDMPDMGGEEYWITVQLAVKTSY